MSDHATSPASGVAVEMTGLRRSYGDVHALDGLDLHLAPGELVVLLGPSGCGKTTALRILAGLERQDAGTISVGGKDLSRVPANKRDMGMVFQAYSLFPHLTVLDNVAFGLKLRGRSRVGRGASAPATCSTWSVSAPRRTATPTSSPAASSSGSPWRGRSRSSRRCCCSTSRCPPSTPRCGSSCATRSAGSSSTSAPRRCS